MLKSKKTTIKPLPESNKEVHLTIYLVNNRDFGDPKSQVQDAVNQSYEWLNPVMSLEERIKFLGPLDAFLLDAGILSQMNGNIGLFRKHDSIRILNTPAEVERTCQVTTSFHVKPLLKGMQHEQEFLLLGQNKDS